MVHRNAAQYRVGVDLICFYGEYPPSTGAARCLLAVGRALGFPCLVRVPAARAEYLLQALDAGAAVLVIFSSRQRLAKAAGR